jgi:hypothetical protein
VRERSLRDCDSRRACRATRAELIGKRGKKREGQGRRRNGGAGARVHREALLGERAAPVSRCGPDGLQSRVQAVADEVERDDVYATGPHVFYVACTRTRSLVTGLPA